MFSELMPLMRKASYHHHSGSSRIAILGHTTLVLPMSVQSGVNNLA
jgi:hypothetical protein